jgi:hypothetical protein
MILPPNIPVFVSEMIEGGLWPSSGEELSFISIIETLKTHDFGILAGVDSDEVSTFVGRVESATEFDKFE